MKTNLKTSCLAILLGMGLLLSGCQPTPVSTPAPTPTATTAPVVFTPEPTPSNEEMLNAALENACRKQPAASPEVGASASAPAGAMLCPDVPNGITLPESWVATTPGNLRYVVEIFENTTNTGGSCGPYTLTGEAPSSGSGDYALIELPIVGIDLIDVKTGSQMTETIVQGPAFACPQKIPAGTKTLTGNPVSTEAVQAALINVLRNYLPALSSDANASPPPPAGLPTLSGDESMVFSPDGKFLATGSSNDTVKLWNVASWTILHVLRGFTWPADHLAFSPDGKILATGWADTAIMLWDVGTGNVLRTLTGHTDGIWSLAFSPDGKQLASGSWDGTVRVWDMASGDMLRTVKGNYLAAFSPDGRLLATASTDNAIYLWDANSGDLLRTLTGHTEQINNLVFSPDGTTLASGSTDETILQWDVASGALLHTLTGSYNTVWSLAISPDGKWLASGALETGSVMLWDAASGKLLGTREYDTDTVNGLVFSPDGKLLAIAGRNEVFLVKTEGLP